MNEEYSTGVIKNLEARAEQYSLHRPMRLDRYEEGDELTYRMRSVGGNESGTVTLEVEKFVGGGFAGQVYRVRIIDINAVNGAVGGIEKGNVYAMKILIPPSGFSLLFRNALYFIGFQGPFQLQVNPAAARAGALWQKFIRRGAKIRFGSDRAVVDIHATFVDDEGVRLLKERDTAVVITLAAPYLVEFMGSKAGIKPEVLEKSRGRFQQKIKSYKMMQENGIRIGVGSDAGTPLNEHHDFAREIELMVREGGISPLEAIRAATQLGATLLGWEDRIGTIEKGKLADLVVLSEDPLSDIQNLRSVEMVFINGNQAISA